MKRTASSLEASLLPWLNVHACAKPNTAGYWTIQTILGILKVHVCDDWIACRFDGDLEPAKAHFGVYTIGGPGRLNPHSGKWNFHAWEVQPYGEKLRRDSKEVLNRLADVFIGEVEQLMPAHCGSSC